MLWGEKISLRVDNTQITGFWYPQKINSNKLILLTHDHKQDPTQVSLIAEFFHNQGFHTLIYVQRTVHNKKHAGLGHIDFEGHDCLQLLYFAHSRIKELYGKEALIVGGFGIGFGATTLLQIEKNIPSFDFIIAEQIPISAKKWLEIQTTHLLKPFWWRFILLLLFKTSLKIHRKLSIDTIDNRFPCDIPILILNSQHPTILPNNTYQILPYWSKSYFVDFHSNHLDSALFSEPERYLFIIDTFLQQIMHQKILSDD